MEELQRNLHRCCPSNHDWSLLNCPPAGKPVEKVPASRREPAFATHFQPEAAATPYFKSVTL